MLLFIQSIIVYGLIIWVMTYFGNIAYKCQYPQGFGGIDMSRKKMSFITLLTKSYFLIPILVFCFFAAVRYKVGVDCESYKNTFYYISQFGDDSYSSNIEKGCKSIIHFTALFTDSHYLFFFILAFLEISLLYYAQRKQTYSLKFFGVSLFFSAIYFSLMNGMRQNIAACAFVALVPLILEKKKWLWYILGVYMATLMHKSAYLLYPLGVAAYFLQFRIPNKYIQLGIVAICFVLMDSIQIPGIEEIFSNYGAAAGYDDRRIEAYNEQELTTKTFGLRSILLLLSYLITIWHSEKMKSYFNSKVFNIQYNLFFIGVCLFLLFYNNFVIGRLSYYFKIFIPIILSTNLFYLWNNKNKENVLYFRIMLLFMVMFFMYELYSSSDKAIEYSLYKFDLFRIKT